MPESKSLRAVSEGERAPAPMSVDAAARRGSRRDLLVAMRNRVADAVADDTTQPRDLAALTRRLQDIARDIESVDGQADQRARVVELEKALRQLSPDHHLLASAVNDKFDASAV